MAPRLTAPRITVLAFCGGSLWAEWKLAPEADVSPTTNGPNRTAFKPSGTFGPPPLHFLTAFVERQDAPIRLSTRFAQRTRPVALSERKRLRPAMHVVERSSPEPASPHRPPRSDLPRALRRSARVRTPADFGRARRRRRRRDVRHR